MTKANRPWNERPWGLYTQETVQTINLKHIYLPALKVNINLCHDLYMFQKKYRQNVSALKYTSVEDTPEMVQAKISSKLVLDVRLFYESVFESMNWILWQLLKERRKCCIFSSCMWSSCQQRLYRKKGENEMHKYTLIGDIPEHVQAKINAMNISEVRIHYTHCCFCFNSY